MGEERGHANDTETRTLRLGRERLRRDCSRRMKRLEVGKRRDRVPVVLNEAKVREGVGEVGEGRELEDERLLLIGLEKHGISEVEGGGRTDVRCLRRALVGGRRGVRWWKRWERCLGKVLASRQPDRRSLECTRRPRGSCRASRRLELYQDGDRQRVRCWDERTRAYGEPGEAGARMKVRSKDRTPIVGSEERGVVRVTLTQGRQRKGTRVRCTRRARQRR